MRDLIFILAGRLVAFSVVAAAEFVGTLWERLRRPRSAMDAEAPARLQALIGRALVAGGLTTLVLR